MKNDRYGFVLVAWVLVISLAVLLGFTGWYVYRARISLNNTTQTQASTAKTASPSATTINAGDADNGKTITVRVHQTLVVTLASTYWTIDETSDIHVLKMEGAQVSAPSHNCVPGGGCGITSARFIAVAAGTAVVSANRITCGEALACTSSQGSFSIVVVVK